MPTLTWFTRNWLPQAAVEKPENGHYQAWVVEGHLVQTSGNMINLKQIQEDVEADSDTLGKTAGKDADSNKPTYVSILGIGAAKQHAKTLYEQAITALAPLGSRT
jgi:hypothetical protein